MTEIRCDACHVSFRYWGADRIEQRAQSMGWHVQDITLCPSCSDLWVSSNPDLYGRHARPLGTDSLNYWWWIASTDLVVPKRRPTGCHRNAATIGEELRELLVAARSTGDGR